jgi:hypothetical protein
MQRPTPCARRRSGFWGLRAAPSASRPQACRRSDGNLCAISREHVCGTLQQASQQLVASTTAIELISATTPNWATIKHTQEIPSEQSSPHSTREQSSPHNKTNNKRAKLAPFNHIEENTSNHPATRSAYDTTKRARLAPPEPQRKQQQQTPKSHVETDQLVVSTIAIIPSSPQLQQ